MSSVGRFLVVAGVALVVLGILVGLAPQTPWLGRLPGDLRIERPGFRLYVPIASCLLLSVVLSALLYAISRLR